MTRHSLGDAENKTRIPRTRVFPVFVVMFAAYFATAVPLSTGRARKIFCAP